MTVMRVTRENGSFTSKAPSSAFATNAVTAKDIATTKTRIHPRNAQQGYHRAGTGHRNGQTPPHAAIRAAGSARAIGCNLRNHRCKTSS